MAALSLKMWARESFDAAHLVDGMSAEEAIQAARSLQEEDDFEAPSSIDTVGLDHARLEALLEVAAAVLTANPRPEIGDDDMEWLRAVLLSAAAMPRAGLVIPESHYPSDLKVSAALGLGALVASGQADQEVRVALLALVCDVEHQVVGAVFRGLRNAWSRDPVLCWGCFSLAVSLCCLPKTAVVPFSGLELNDAGRQWLNDLWVARSGQLGAETIPDLPPIGDREDVYFRSERIVNVLGPLPLDALGSDREGKQKILALHDHLMAWTVEPEGDEDDDERSHRRSDYTWEMNFLQWSARVANILAPDEEEVHVIRPVLATWPKRPRLLQQLLRGYLSERLGSLGTLPDAAVAAWVRVWNTLLDSPEFKSRSRWPGSATRDEEIDSLAVFVSFGRYFWNDQWPHAGRFEGLIDRWVRTVGVSHTCYHSLITMLKPNLERFAPRKVLEWLERIVQTSKDVRALWAAYDNGTQTAALLMSLRSKHGEALTREQLTPRLSRLVDALVGAGVSAATLLQRELETRD